MSEKEHNPNPPAGARALALVIREWADNAGEEWLRDKADELLASLRSQERVPAGSFPQCGISAASIPDDANLSGTQQPPVPEGSQERELGPDNPIWLAGNDRGVEAACEAMEKALAGDTGGTYASPRLDAIAKRLAALGRSEALPALDVLGPDASGRSFPELLRLAADMLRESGGGPVEDCLRLKADEIDAVAPPETQAPGEQGGKNAG